MPIYEFECTSCGHRFEKMMRMSADPPPCPACAAAVRKLISHSAFILKGGGWYKDHYGLKSDGKGDAKGEAKSEAKGEAKSEAKGEAKAEAKGEAKAEGKGAAKADAAPKADAKPASTPAPTGPKPASSAGAAAK